STIHENHALRRDAALRDEIVFRAKIKTVGLTDTRALTGVRNEIKHNVRRFTLKIDCNVIEPRCQVARCESTNLVEFSRVLRGDVDRRIDKEQNKYHAIHFNWEQAHNG